MLRNRECKSGTKFWSKKDVSLSVAWFYKILLIIFGHAYCEETIDKNNTRMYKTYLLTSKETRIHADRLWFLVDYQQFLLTTWIFHQIISYLKERWSNSVHSELLSAFEKHFSEMFALVMGLVSFRKPRVSQSIKWRHSISLTKEICKLPTLKQHCDECLLE